MRKEAGLKVEQRIVLSIVSTGKLMQKVINSYIDKIVADKLTSEFKNEKISDEIISKNIEINKENVEIQLKRI